MGGQEQVEEPTTQEEEQVSCCKRRWQQVPIKISFSLLITGSWIFNLKCYISSHGICVNCHVENYGYYCAATKNSKFEYMKFHLKSNLQEQVLAATFLSFSCPLCCTS